MAAAGGYSRMEMILARDLPRFTGEAECVLMYETAKWASLHQYIHLEEIFYEGIADITKNLGRQLYTRFERIDVFHKIIQMRDSFSKFRQFISNPFVEYEPIPNLVRILPGYYHALIGAEEPQHVKGFQDNGFPTYRNCKYVFVTCKAAMFWGEPEENSWEKITRRESDDEEEDFSEFEDSVTEDEEMNDDEED